jgi:hypothetical protein
MKSLWPTQIKRYTQALKTKADEVSILKARALERVRKQMEEKGHAEKNKKEYPKTHKMLVAVAGRTEATIDIYGGLNLKIISQNRTR